MSPGPVERISVTVIETQAKAEKHVPGEAGLWIFLFGEIMLFSLYFIIFVHDRGNNVALFRASQTQLNQSFGLLNTVFMLSSSWFVAKAVRAARGDMGRTTPLCFAFALLCGMGFTVVKFFEYGEMIHAGITLQTNDFFMYYYMFTTFHLMHLLIGMGVLGVMACYTLSGGFDARKITHVEIGASYWHVVDLLWIVLFALLYLVK